MLTKSTEESTIELLAKRSDAAVLWLTTLVAVGVLLADQALSLVYPVDRGDSDGYRDAVPWGIWIPLCFLIIPPVHYLARYVLRLERHVARLKERVAALEAREVTTHVVGTPGEPTL
jgi:hypothetical protein